MVRWYDSWGGKMINNNKPTGIIFNIYGSLTEHILANIRNKMNEHLAPCCNKKNNSVLLTFSFSLWWEMHAHVLYRFVRMNNTTRMTRWALSCVACTSTFGIDMYKWTVKLKQTYVPFVRELLQLDLSYPSPQDPRGKLSWECYLDKLLHRGTQQYRMISLFDAIKLNASPSLARDS